MAQFTRMPTRNSVDHLRNAFGALIGRSARGSRVASAAAANSSVACSHSVGAVPTAASTAPAIAGPMRRPLACALCCNPSAFDRPAAGTSSVTMLLLAGMISAPASTAMDSIAMTTARR